MDSEVEIVLAGNVVAASATFVALPGHGDLSTTTALACVTDRDGDSTAATVTSVTVVDDTVTVEAQWEIPDSHGGGEHTFTVDTSGPLVAAVEGCFNIKRRAEPAVPAP